MTYKSKSNLKNPTIYDIAKESQVSLATVSRVINGNPAVKKTTRIKVEKAIEKYGYTPSSLAQSLSIAKTTTIAIIIPQGYYSYISIMQSGMLDVAKIYGYRTMVFTLGINEDLNEIDSFINKVSSSRPDGIVVYHPFFTNEENVKLLDQMSKHYVIISDQQIKTTESNMLLHLVMNPTYEELFQSIAKGKKNPCIVSYKHSNLLGVKEAEIAIKKYNFSSIIVDAGDSYTEAYLYFYERFKNGELKNTYFIGFRDSLIASIVNAASDLKIKIPEEIEAASVYCTRYSTICRPQITGYYEDFYEIGSISMRLITKILSNIENENQYEYNITFNKRGTTL